MLGNSPVFVEQSDSVDGGKVLEKVFVADPEYTIVAKGMVQLLHHVRRPEFASVAPISFPLDFTPWIPKLQKFQIALFPRSKYRIGVASNKAFDTVGLGPASK